ncbi:alpha/beta fold hydrolase [Achromobacter aloeverae]|uniref:alpha/beta fold hydrolase n=1 Tax=Achromobacter aloeverae TaxID=1750518 RepID=UPI001F014190|nr:alpha/beta fold hydrolase [Achromobacter aloeverae]
MSRSPVHFKTPRHARAVGEAYAAAVAHWPAGHRRIELVTGQGRTHVIVCGRADAPPLVLLHGAASTAASWLHYVTAWAAHFHIHAVDVIGEAGPSAASRPPLSGDAHARWLAEVLDGLRLERAAFAGISLGAWLALDLALRCPRRVKRLALLCPPGIGRQRAFLWWALPLLALGESGRAIVRRQVLGELPRPVTPAELASRRLMDEIDRGFRPRRETIPVFADEALQGLRAPTLVIVGGRDVMLDSRHTRDRLGRLAPQARVELLPAQRHFIHGQRERILDFLCEGDDHDDRSCR